MKDNKKEIQKEINDLKEDNKFIKSILSKHKKRNWWIFLSGNIVALLCYLTSGAHISFYVLWINRGSYLLVALPIMCVGWGINLVYKIDLKIRLLENNDKLEECYERLLKINDNEQQYKKVSKSYKNLSDFQKNIMEVLENNANDLERPLTRTRKLNYK